VPHLSTGDIIRDAIRDGLPLGKQAEQYVQRGALVPDELMASIVERTLTVGSGKHGFLLDGYPRTLEQAHFLDSIAPLDAVVNITMREDHIVQKLLGRRACADCGAAYNIAHIDEDGIFMPALLPKEPVCANLGRCTNLVSRDDDTEAVIRHRLQVHSELTVPVTEYYHGRQEQQLHNQPGMQFISMHVEGGYEVMTPRFFEALGVKEGAQGARL
jgi:adenylate kinase